MMCSLHLSSLTQTSAAPEYFYPCAKAEHPGVTRVNTSAADQRPEAADDRPRQLTAVSRGAEVTLTEARLKGSLEFWKHCLISW